jgi:hypothetical protein
MTTIPPNEGTAIAKLIAVRNDKNKDLIDGLIKQVKEIKNCKTYKEVGDILFNITEQTVKLPNTEEIDKYLTEYTNLVGGNLARKK